MLTRERVVAAAAIVVAGAVIVVALATALDGDGGGDRRPVAERDVDRMLAASCPSGKRATSRRVPPDELAQAQRGVFDVFEKPVRLEPPVDWSMDPLNAHRFRQNLHKFRYLKPLLSAYRSDGDIEALEEALELVLDWSGANPLGGEGVPENAWADKVVGDRIPFLAYTTRAAACERLLDRGRARELLTSLRDHGRFLSDPSIYVPDNHGLFADRGLILLADYLPFLTESERWERLATRRFRSTLDGRLADGIWLEHSTAYQFFVLGAAEDFLKYARDAKLEGMVARMREAAAWLVMPDREMTQFGSSNQQPVPEPTLRRAEDLDGMRVFPKAGFAVVRSQADGGQDSYLAVTAGFHNITHKQADDLSFELYEGGHRVVADTGLYHKDPGPERDFVLSAAAHSVLAVDGETFPIEEGLGYGSGIVATGEGDGWNAILGRNPLLGEQGVRHHRLFLYAPGSSLVVVDRVRADAPHDYSRYFQLGPGLDVEAGDNRALSLRAGGLEGELDDAPGNAPSQRSEVRGQREPLAGWTSPQFREFLPRWTVTYESEGEEDAVYVASVLVNEDAPRALRAEWQGDRAGISLEDGTRIEVRVAGGELTVAERQGQD